MASSLRDISMSIEYRLWQIMCQGGWMIDNDYCDLVPDVRADAPPNSFCLSFDMGGPDPVEGGGYPWVFWDANAINTNHDNQTIYYNGQVANTSNYSIDFLNGRVSFTTPIQGTITGDINYFPFHLMEGYPHRTTATIIMDRSLPIIAFTVNGMGGPACDLRSAACDYRIPLSIYIMAQNDGWRKDVCDSLVKGLRRMPYFDISSCWMLTAAGDSNLNFNAALQLNNYLRVGRDPEARLTPPMVNASSKQEYQATVNVEYRIAM